MVDTRVVCGCSVDEADGGERTLETDAKRSFVLELLVRRSRPQQLLVWSDFVSISVAVLGQASKAGAPHPVVLLPVQLRLASCTWRTRG